MCASPFPFFSSRRGKRSAIKYEKAEEKNGGSVTETANWYAGRAGMPVTTPVWTNRPLACSAVDVQNSFCFADCCTVVDENVAKENSRKMNY